MPASGAVYQPTTVTCEQLTPENGGNTEGPTATWTRPVSYLSQTVSSRPAQARLFQWLTLFFGMFLLAAGLVMMIDGSINYSRGHEPATPTEETSTVDPPSTDSTPEDKPGNEPGEISDLIVAILGALLTLIGILLLAIYIHTCRRRQTCSWWRGKDLTSGNGRDNGVAGGTMNPSTDLLVTAQYAPVSEVAYQPPAALAAEERSKLMAESKDCTSGEESDRMLESDPRIVLKPQSHTEETA